MRDPESEDFDWVRARHECSAVQAFQRLKLQAEETVKKRQAIREERADKQPFQFEYRGPSFLVFKGTTAAVEFVLDGDRLHVEPDGEGLGAKFTATLTLNDDGECRFRANGRELRSWQLLRMALETLFFG